MLQHECREYAGIVAVTPSEPLTAEEFAILAREIDPYIERAGPAERVASGCAAVSQLAQPPGCARASPVREGSPPEDPPIAVVTDHRVLSVLPSLVRHFVAAEVRHFPAAAREEAMRWLEAGPVAA
jgi:SpoIIAA-like